MAITVVGAEAEDFTVTGVWAYGDSGNTPYRSGYQRGSLYQTTAGVGSKLACKQLASAKTTHSFSARFGGGIWTNASEPIFIVTDGGASLFGVWTTVTSGYFKLLRWNGASWDTLATGAKPSNAPIRLDMYVENYGATGRIRVWLTYTGGVAPATLWLDSGTVDIATPGSVNFNGAYCGTYDTSGAFTDDRRSAAEFVGADEPTHRMSLVTCYPNAAGDVNQWTGAYTDVDELIASQSDYTETGSAGQLFLANITDLPSAVTLTPLGVQVTILAAKGATGPTSIKIAIKTHGTVYYSGTIALDIAYAGYSYLWTVNPSTGITWTQAEITALQIGYESVA